MTPSPDFASASKRQTMARPQPQLAALHSLKLDVLIGVLMPPVLLSLLGGRAVADLLMQLGQMSEGLYRGHRLPALTIPPNSSDPTHQA